METKEIKSINSNRRLVQIGIIVEDIDVSMAAWYKHLSVGPFQVYRLDHTMIENLYTQDPEHAEFELALATATLGNIQIELIQPIRGETIFSDYFTKYGGGVHHIKELCDDVDSFLEHVKGTLEPIMRGGSKEEGFCFLENDELKMVYEVGKEGEFNYAQKVRIFPEGDVSDLIEFNKNREITQIGVVVNDYKSAIKTWHEQLGYGPFRVYRFNDENTDNMYLNGACIDDEKFQFYVIHALIGGLQFELLQAEYGASSYEEFINNYGEGVHHIKESIKNDDEKMISFIEKIEQSGCELYFKGRCQNDLFYYFKADGLNCVYEIGNSPELAMEAYETYYGNE